MKQLKEKILTVRDMEAVGRDHVEAMYERPSHKERKRVILAIMSKFVQGKDFLDLGCAEGIYCKEAYNLKATNIVGVDVSIKKIERAIELYPDLKFRTADSDQIHETFEQSFDFILCTEVLQHIVDYKNTILSILKVLKISGLLLLSVPNLSKTDHHVFADIDNNMSEEELLREIGGAGYGKQNALWKFNTDILEKELTTEYPLRLIEKVPVDTPDGEIKNLWTVFLFEKSRNIKEIE